jgi:hypothetical protein
LPACDAGVLLSCLSARPPACHRPCVAQVARLREERARARAEHAAAVAAANAGAGGGRTESSLLGRADEMRKKVGPPSQS